MNGIRAWLYMVAKLLGDAQAIARGRIWQRAFNRLTGKVSGRVMGKVWK
jgi:hypothetical protein